MYTLNKHAIVPYSNRQMFELVNDIEGYQRFLPWCRSTKIISRTDKEVTATVEVSWKGVHKSFTTKNTLEPYERMKIDLVNGPLKHLEGVWKFIPLDEQACKVILDLEFEFAGNFIDRFFQPVFQYIANTLVDSFVKRAVEVYGNQYD